MSSLFTDRTSILCSSINYEEQRLQALEQYNILYTAAEEEFDVLVALASTICDTPISLISLITHDRQWFKAGIGLEIEETPLSVSFCQYAIKHDEVLEVPDALSDIRFYQNPFVVGEPKIRFYAGAPLVNKDGFKLGTLCVVDLIPKELTEKQRLALATLAEQVVAHLELRRMKEQLELEKQQLVKAWNLLQQVHQMPYLSGLKSSLSTVHYLTNKLETAVLTQNLPAAANCLRSLKAQLQNLETGLDHKGS
ncbi:GAF domain-containing protein [Pontibacter sp. 13R65]|uniref:GAF domain-containing protein n=1 Tax=Pontibacter sp. 13R65 TaxID=3127458 RepID=UPI00301E1560